MFCRKCGKEIADDSTFCNKCGTPVAEEKKPATNSKLWDYNNALKKLKTAKTIEEFDEVEKIFKSLGDFKDSVEQAKKGHISTEICALNYPVRFTVNGTPYKMSMSEISMTYYNRETTT